MILLYFLVPTRWCGNAGGDAIASPPAHKHWTLARTSIGSNKGAWEPEKFHLVMTEATLRVAGRRAFLNEFPNRVWELEKGK
ncbi:MAG TPA: hypothetical protein ENG03_12375 [Thioploca sp.]|nr:hypothetical protein [Thioploca sp.]